MKWLSGDEAIAGTVSNESDVPIEHTRKQDVVWFYSSIFLAPVLVIGLGLAVTRRTRHKKRTATPHARNEGPSQGKMEGAAS
jgi:hypothetical protein